MKPLQIMERPTMHPYVCAVCGTGHDNRDHFVDLGIDSVLHNIDQWGQKHYTDGVIYFCNLCMTSKIIDYLRQVFEFVNNQKGAKHLLEKQELSAVGMYTKEIEKLRAENARLLGQISDLQNTILNPENPGEDSGKSVLEGLVGNIEEDDGTGSDNSAVDATVTEPTVSNPGTSGADKEPASPDFQISDLFDIRAGLIASGNSNKS